MSTDTQTPSELALAFEPAGYEQIPEKTVLTRLNYYDGKFLRADSLRLEQDYLRRLAELGARAGGSGLVYGFDVFLGTDEQLTIGGGLGYDAAGRVLYLPNAFDVGLQKLIDITRQTVPQAFASAGSAGFEICEPDSTKTPPAGTSGAEFFLVTVAHAEEACGEEDVFGKLCDDGCATSTDRAYLLEGVIVRAVPFHPKTPFVTSKAVSLTERHLRSQLASATFEDERRAVPSRISKAGLLSDAWCTGAPRPTGWEVPIAIVGRLSSRTFVDEWIVRRERIDVPPRRFWAWTMAMRPWESYLAQILQFQCQLPSALAGHGGDATATDPCAVRVDALEDAAKVFDELEVAYAGDIEIPIARTKLQAAHLQLKKVIASASAPSQRILIDGGIVELPPAGYLPVTPGVEPPVQEQVRRLLGPGVDLRFCAATADFVAHALEEAQHMERISLLHGLDNPNDKPKVDILVPDGAVAAAPPRQALGWDTQIGVSGTLFGSRSLATGATTNLPMRVGRGAGRSAQGSDGSFEFLFAGEQQAGFSGTALMGTMFGAAHVAGADETLSEDAAADDGTTQQPIGAYASVRCSRNPFELSAGETFTIEAEGAAGVELDEVKEGATGTAHSSFVVRSRAPLAAGGQRVTADGTLSGEGRTVGESPDEGSDSVDLELRLDLHAERTPPTVEARLQRSASDDDDGEVLVWATWQGTPLGILVAAGEGQGDDAGATVTLGEAAFPKPPLERVLAVAALRRSDAVFDDGNPAHEAAQSGLETLAHVFDDSRYTDDIEQQLFERDAGEGGASGALSATRDWVLFHRRRVKDCDVVAPVPVPAPVATTKHLVMFVDSERFTRVRSALKAGSLATALKLSEKVGEAEFDKDTADLRTPVATLKSEWIVFADSPPLAAAVAAASVAADVLLKDQAKAAAAACGAGVLKPLETYAVQGIPTGYDAVTFLKGSRKVADVSYAVSGTWNFDQFSKLVESRDLDAFLNLGEQTVRSLGDVTFDQGTTNALSNHLLQWKDVLGGGFVAEVVVVTRPGESTSEDVDAQVTEILKLTGSPAPLAASLKAQVIESTNSDQWPIGTDLICIVLAVDIN